MAAAQEFITPAADSCEQTDLAHFDKKILCILRQLGLSLHY